LTNEIQKDPIKIPDAMKVWIEKKRREFDALPEDK